MRPATDFNESATHSNRSATDLNRSGTHLNESGTHLNRLATLLNESATHLNRLPTHSNRFGTHLNGSGTHLNRLATDSNGLATHLNELAFELGSNFALLFRDTCGCDRSVTGHLRMRGPKLRPQCHLGSNDGLSPAGAGNAHLGRTLKGAPVASREDVCPGVRRCSASGGP